MIFDINLRLEDFSYSDGVLSIAPVIYKETSEDNDWDDEFIVKNIGEIKAFIITPTFDHLEMLEKMDMTTEDGYDLFLTMDKITKDGKVKSGYYMEMLERSICYIQDFKINEDEQKNGYGAKALKRLSDLLAGFGVWDTYLVAKSRIMSNEKINKFYEDNGFEVLHKNYDEDEWINTIMYRYNG